MDFATAAALPWFAATTAPPPLCAHDADAWARESTDRDRESKEEGGKEADM